MATTRKPAGEKGRTPHKTFMAKGRPDNKAERKLPRISLAIAKQFLQKTLNSFQKGTKIPITLPTRAPYYKRGYMENINPEKLQRPEKPSEKNQYILHGNRH